MSIRIVTDSASDLPAELLAAHGITVVPIYINFGTYHSVDGVDLSREEFYEQLPRYSPSPTTGIPAPEAFIQAYERLAEEGATEVLSIHISPSLSGMVDVARVAAERTTALPVTVLDSRQLSMGLGFLALAAAKAAAAGRSMVEILALLEEQIPRTLVAAALDTLEFLRRSGRMNGVVSRIGNLLQIKPILKMVEGSPTAERVRTRKHALDRMVALIGEMAPLEQVAILHANAREQAEAFRQRIADLLPGGDTMLSVITPVLGAHIGPGVVGFACVRARS